MNLPGNSAENRLPEQQQNEKTHLKSESIQQSMLFIQGSKDTPRNSSLGTSVCSSSTEDVTVTTGSMASLFQVYYELKRDSWACAWRRHWKWRLEGLGKLKNSKGWSGWRIEMSPFFETLMRIWSVQLAWIFGVGIRSSMSLRRGLMKHVVQKLSQKLRTIPTAILANCRKIRDLQ